MKGVPVLSRCRMLMLANEELEPGREADPPSALEAMTPALTEPAADEEEPVDTLDTKPSAALRAADGPAADAAEDAPDPDPGLPAAAAAAAAAPLLVVAAAAEAANASLWLVSPIADPAELADDEGAAEPAEWPVGLASCTRLDAIPKSSSMTDEPLSCTA